MAVEDNLIQFSTKREKKRKDQIKIQDVTEFSL
jgi:hypothetical protein